MAVVPHFITDAITQWMTRRFGGARPEMILSPDQVERLRPAVKAAQKRFYWVCIPLGLLSAAGLAWLLVWLRRATEPAPNGAVLDEHSRFLWMGFGVVSFMLSTFVCSFFELRAARHVFEPDRELFRHYYATTTGWLPGRRLVCLAVIAAPSLAFMGLLCRNIGDVVDLNGVAWGNHPLARIREPMSAVKSIELFDGLMAPIGLRMVANVRVTFADGREWYNVPGDTDLHVPGVVAAFLSKQSGVPVTRRGVKR